MGEYFAKQKKEIKDKEVQLIDDFEEIVSQFNNTVNGIRMMNEESFPIISNDFESLFGKGDRIDDIGEIDRLKKSIKSSRLNKISVGRDTWQVLDTAEKLIGWMDRRDEFNEGFIDALKVICQSAFKKITKLDEENEELHNKVQELQAKPPEFPEQTGVKPVPVYTVGPEEIQYLKEAFNDKYKLYLEVEERGEQSSLQKANIMNLAKRHPAKRELLIKWFRFAESQRRPEEESNNSGKIPQKAPNIAQNNQVYSPVTQNPEEKKDIKEETPYDK